MIRLIGPGGAGKSTIGALLAERLNLPFLDLDRHLASRVGDISDYINRHGYNAYARGALVRCCSLPLKLVSECGVMNLVRQATQS